MQGHDAADPYSRPLQDRALPQAGLRIGVLADAEREFFGDAGTQALYDAAIARMAALGATIVPVDYAPFRECAALLYNGPWVAERLAAIEDCATSHAETMDPIVRAIILGARARSAVEAFRGAYQLEALRKLAGLEWAKMRVLLLPTAPTIYAVEAMQADPVARNSRLGRYTNFVNLLDCCAIATPAGFRADGLPAGVTLVALAFADAALGALANRLHRAAPCGMGRDKNADLPAASAVPPFSDGCIALVLVGAHLTGMPLNHQLTDARAVMLKRCRTAGDYRLFVLPDTKPQKPGVILRKICTH